MTMFRELRKAIKRMTENNPEENEGTEQTEETKEEDTKEN